jgi:hypothetical protein
MGDSVMLLLLINLDYRVLYSLNLVLQSLTEQG